MRLSMRRQDGHATVSVSDQGIGMTPEGQTRLFVPFQRGAQARMVSGGIGLGLHIAAEVVKQHGGRMGVASEPGKGSVFTFILPR